MRTVFAVMLLLCAAGCLQSAPAGAGKCGAIKGDKAEWCLASAAMDEGIIDGCAAVGNAEYRTTCQAVVLGNISLCALSSDPYWSDSCRYFVAVKTGDFRNCANISEDGLRSGCVMDVPSPPKYLPECEKGTNPDETLWCYATGLRDAHACRAINDTYVMESCLSAINDLLSPPNISVEPTTTTLADASRENVTNGCFGSEDPAAQDLCLLALASSRGDLTICNQIGSTYWSRACVIEAAVSEGDERICVRVSDVAGRDACIMRVRSSRDP